MAKISARGATKVKELSFIRIDDDRPEFARTAYHYVLRSDGAILVAHSAPDGATSYDRKRSGYSIAARIEKGLNRADMETVFGRYVAKMAARLNGEMS